MKNPAYRRVLLKLSGEALAGASGTGLDLDVVNFIAKEIHKVVQIGVEIAVVVGGGNIWRGAPASARGMDRVTADYMGMLGTVINALALQDALENLGVETRVQTAIEMREVAEPYIRRRAIRHLEKGRRDLFLAQWNPYFHRYHGGARRRGRDDHGKKGVDGVYSSDPRYDAEAVLLKELDHMDMLQRGLKVMDATAASLCMDNKIPIMVFNFNVEDNIIRAVLGERIGTLVGGKANG